MSGIRTYISGIRTYISGIQPYISGIQPYISGIQPYTVYPASSRRFQVSSRINPVSSRICPVSSRICPVSSRINTVPVSTGIPDLTVGYRIPLVTCNTNNRQSGIQILELTNKQPVRNRQNQYTVDLKQVNSRIFLVQNF